MTQSRTAHQDWIDFVSKDPDILSEGHCGNWLKGIDYIPGKGRLCTFASDNIEAVRYNIQHWPAARERFRNGETDFEMDVTNEQGFFLLTPELAQKAWDLLAEKNPDWFENADASDYDDAVQLALFGELVYG